MSLRFNEVNLNALLTKNLDLFEKIIGFPLTIGFTIIVGISLYSIFKDGFDL